MTHLTLKCFKDVYEFSQAECEEQIEQWEMYRQADNAAKWLLVKMICDLGYSERKAKREAQRVLREGGQYTVKMNCDAPILHEYKFEGLNEATRVFQR